MTKADLLAAIRARDEELAAAPDEELRFSVRGSMAVWLELDTDGNVLDIELTPESFEPETFPGLSFARLPGSDGPDLSPDEVAAVLDSVLGENLEPWIDTEVSWNM